MAKEDEISVGVELTREQALQLAADLMNAAASANEIVVTINAERGEIAVEADTEDDG